MSNPIKTLICQVRIPRAQLDAARAAVTDEDSDETLQDVILGEWGTGYTYHEDDSITLDWYNDTGDPDWLLSALGPYVDPHSHIVWLDGDDGLSGMFWHAGALRACQVELRLLPGPHVAGDVAHTIRELNATHRNGRPA